jgi:outer membrane protein
MKNFYLILCLIFIVLPINSHAQKLKYGYIDATKILMEMPEIDSANKKIDVEIRQINDYINQKNEEYKTKMADFQKSENELNELVKQKKQNELNSLAIDIRTFQQSAQNDMAKKKQDLFKPAIEKLKAAIAAVAKANGMRFIIDNTAGVLLYYEDADNVENLVRKQLGIPIK